MAIHSKNSPRRTDAPLIAATGGAWEPMLARAASTSLDQLRALIFNVPAAGFPSLSFTIGAKKVLQGRASISLQGTRNDRWNGPNSRQMPIPNPLL